MDERQMVNMRTFGAALAGGARAAHLPPLLGPGEAERMAAEPEVAEPARGSRVTVSLTGTVRRILADEDGTLALVDLDNGESVAVPLAALIIASEDRPAVDVVYAQHLAVGDLFAGVVDTYGPRPVRPWLKAHRLTRVMPYLDETGDLPTRSVSLAAGDVDLGSLRAGAQCLVIRL